ncbi:MAG: outer membrane beta-barrel protein [Bacteroidetes bacterium]|nr:outer membrane beta-barrel protein [Bacteroidota bacterium]MBU1423926.1 outer membrane beta-barrel protein [Bacteroidota bacterium]MBU2472391.1 outer membrane beta-barrel protein [Bacteroidota bacterium]MBU2635837.1 outer membrane beta-barrel protein [Bacteroidota bacterium]
MKKLLLILLFLISSTVFTQDKGFGLGVILGEPTGISFKGWTSKTNAIDGGMAWSFTKSTALHLHADYLWHSFDVIESEENIPLYYGVGARVKFGNKDNNRLGVRGIIGLNYLMRKVPVDFFIEIAPILDLIQSTEFSMNGGIGVRYFFR